MPKRKRFFSIDVFPNPSPGLIFAVKRNNVPLIHTILADPRTDPNVKEGQLEGYRGWFNTPLMYAVKENKEDLVKILLADPRVDLYTTENFDRKEEDLAR